MEMRRLWHHDVVGYGLGVAALLVELSRLSVRVQC